MTGGIRRSRMMTARRLGGPAHVFRTCIISLYACPSLASHTEPSEASHMLDTAGNGKCRYARDSHSIDHRTLAKVHNSDFVFRKALNFRGITRRIAPRGAGDQTTHNLPDRLWISKTRRVTVRPMGASSEARPSRRTRWVAIDRRGKFATP